METNKKKAPVAAIIFSALAILGVLVSVGYDIGVNYLPNSGLYYYLARTALLGSSQLIGMILFLVGLFLHRKNGNILCGIGVILNAVPTVSYLIKDSGLFYLSVDLTVVLFLVISAVFYFTKVRVLGMPLKLIFGIFAILATFISVGGTPYIIAQSLNDGLGIFADFEGFIYALTQTKAIIFSLIANLLSAFAAVYFYVAVVFFTPKKG